MFAVGDTKKLSPLQPVDDALIYNSVVPAGVSWDLWRAGQYVFQALQGARSCYNDSTSCYRGK